jgi:hypothetical protein
MVGAPRAGTTAIATYVNVKDFVAVDIVGVARVAAAAAIVWTPTKDYAAAGAGVPAVLGFNAPLWAGFALVNAHVHLVAQADAANYTTVATAGDHMVVFRIETSALGDSAANGPYLYLTCLCTALVADFVSVVFIGYPRHSYGPNNLPDYTA